MAQDYKITDVKKGEQWSNAYGQFQSYSLAIEGHGEPVAMNKKAPVAQEPQIGDTIYGSVDLANGYWKFKGERLPDDEGQPALLPRDKPSPNSDSNYWDDKNAHIKAQWSLGQAVQLQNALAIARKDSALLSSDKVEETAKWFYKAVERTAGLKVQAPIKEQTIEEAVAQKQAERDSKRLEAPDPEFEAMLAELKALEADDINLDDIPF